MPGRSIIRSCRGLALVALGLLVAATAFAQPTLGFRQDWPGTDLYGWTGGGGPVNPGTGGIFGVDDGYVMIATAFPTNLGTNCICPEFHGNWQAAGITLVRLWLDDVNTSDPLEIHFAIGNGTNFWQYNPGFVPPHNAWAEFFVDLTSSSNFTRIIGSGTFDDALQNADRLLIRHDKPAFVKMPDPVQGDVGIDGLELTNSVVGVPLGGASATRPVELAPPYPNPSRGPVAFSFRTFDGGPVRLEIVDVAGRSMKRVELPAAAPGRRIWLWDGRDGQGRPVAPGSYRARAIGAAGGAGRPLVRID